MKTSWFRKGVFLVLGSLVGFLFDFSAIAQSPSETTKAEPVIRQALSPNEEQFLACAARCGFGAHAQKPLACLDWCQKDAKLSDEDVAKFVRSSFAGVGLLGRRGGGVLEFSCEIGQSTCSCSGYFDCKALEKSGCCDGSINTCTQTNGKETCTCKKSSQCTPGL